MSENGATIKNITYVKGDATAPIYKPAIIAHIVNDQGGWGRGFVKSLSNKYPYAEDSYRQWAQGEGPRNFLVCSPWNFEIGRTQFVTIDHSICIANMCAQHGYKGESRPLAVNYSALSDCIGAVVSHARKFKDVSIHMPRVGCGLGGGNWSDVLEAMWEARVTGNLGPWPPIYVYDLPE